MLFWYYQKWEKQKSRTSVRLTFLDGRKDLAVLFHARKEGVRMADGLHLDVDVSDLQDLINRLQSVMTERQFENAMYGIFKRTGGHVRKILRSDLPKQYEIKPKDINQAVRNPKVSTGMMGVGCSIPVVGPRRSIGPGGFSASGGAHGWNSLRRKYRVKVRIVRSGPSTLPEQADSYGGQPPFRNLSAKKLHGLAFTRAAHGRVPIEKMVGIAIPQMPMNRSEADVKADIKAYLEKEVERRFNALLMNGR